MPNDTRQVSAPVQALRFEAPLEFEFRDEREQPEEAAVRLLARSGDPIEHPFWGRIVHDLSGMRPRKPVLQLNWRHFQDETLGLVDNFDTSSGDLVVSGKMISVREADQASVIMARGRAGIPYEASIDFNGPGLRLEELGEGATAEVNGRTVEGPIWIVREWPLRSVAVVPFGADENAEAEFADRSNQVTVNVVSAKGQAMPDPTKQHSDPGQGQQTQQQGQQGSQQGQESQQGQQTQQGQQAPQPAEQQGQQHAPASETPATPPQQPASQQTPPESAAQQAAGDDPRSQFTAELQRFTKQFGAENGAKWFSEGKTYEQALELHAECQNQALAAERQRNQELSEKLQSLDRGEETPVEFQDTTASEAGQRTNEFEQKLGTGLGRFAAAIKLPKPSTN